MGSTQEAKVSDNRKIFEISDTRPHVCFFFNYGYIFKLHLLVCMFVYLLGTVHRNHSACREVRGHPSGVTWSYGSNSSCQARDKKLPAGPSHGLIKGGCGQGIF